MALDLDNFAFHSQPSSFRVGDESKLALAISGTVGAGATRTWTGSTSITSGSQSAQIYLSQDNHPTSFANYTSGALLPYPAYTGTQTANSMFTDVTGIIVNSIAMLIKCSISGNTLNASVQVFNFAGTTMTVTANNINFHYVVAQPVGL